MRVNFKALILLVLSSALVTGCAVRDPFITKAQAFPKMYEQKPASLLVVPAINTSTAAEATDYLTTTLAEPLSMYGYYVAPIETTTAVFAQEGIVDGAQLSNLDPQFVGNQFGTDAVLFVTINEWDTSYYVVGGNVTVGLEYDLFSTKTGERLWRYKERQTVDTTSDQGGILGLIITAVQTAVTDYVPIAKRVNYMSLSSKPFGKYHPMHGTDMEQKAVHIDKASSVKTESN